MTVQMILLTTVLLPIYVYSQTVSPGHVWLTLNECGKYEAYQQFTLGSDKTLRLTQDTNTCVECSNVGYCTPGFFPVTSTGCSSSNYMEQWNAKTINGKVVNLVVNGLCLTPMGAEDYAMVTVLNCNIGYNNNDLQQWQVNPNGKNYIVSNLNQSLCLTANKYEPRNCSQSPYNTYDYCNTNVPTHDRVHDLLSRMSLYEKVSNLAYGNIGVPRLGIPANMQLECLHGIRTDCGKTYNGNTGCPSSFPHALLLGASFNRSLWHRIGEAISDEGRALNNQGIGGLYCYSPDINLFRDPRWGRGQEVPGEDPFLTGQYGMQYINGIQYGEDTRYLKMSNTVKHYADYSIEGGRYGIPARTDFNAIVSEQEQVEYYWPAFRAAIQVGGVHSIMCSYPAINGVPACGNDFFMNEIARNQWGFDGFFISDEGALSDEAFKNYINKLYPNASIAEKNMQMCRIGIESGCDIDLGGFWLQWMQDSVENGIVKESVIDIASNRFWSRVI
eukprot:407987_1